VAGIYLSDIRALSYADTLFQARKLRSVTANTRIDGEEFLRLAARHGITATTVPYAIADADRALADLAHGRFSGAAVLHVDGSA
jgi:alcohol dehydrogenase, propanol-preferring